jgi:hypothetical protein
VGIRAWIHMKILNSDEGDARSLERIEEGGLSSIDS